VDEIQLLLRAGDYESWKNNNDNKQETTMYIFLKAMMETVVAASSRNVFIIPVVSGTFLFEPFSLFPPTLYKHVPAVIQHLPIECASKLVIEEMRERGELPKICEKPTLLNRLISMLGM
jgi:hypothetical protein